MILETKVNCQNCREEKHDNCERPDSCKCAYYEHSNNLLIGVRVSKNMDIPKHEPLEYENALRDSERLKEIIENGRENNSEDFTIRELTKLLILSDHKISIIDIKKIIETWCDKFGIIRIDIGDIITSTLQDPEIFTNVKDIALNLGQRKKEIVFDKSQLIEASHWLMGRFNIKRIELTGDLIFFNDQYYEKNAEALIRRNVRTCLIKSKNNDVNEIVKYIEDSCIIVKSSDIENFTHLKCLLNGVYDIKNGVFSTKFDPNHIILNQIPHNFDESKQCPNITKRVSEIIVDDNDKQSYFDFGSNCLHAYTGIDFQFGGVGIAGTGKSQLAVLLQLTFGSDNVTHATIHSIAKDPTTQKDIAYGFLNIDEELKSDDVKNIEILKKWITQGRITARSIYAHNSNFRPTSRLMFLTNGIYEIGNPDDALAIYERTHLIKLTQKFRHTKKEIKNIFENIDESEFEGFITYLLKNSTEIYKNKQINYPQSTQKTESIWNEYGNDIRNFVDTWLLNGVGLKEQASEIWNKFFTEQSDKGKPPKSKNHFYDKFNEIIGSSATLIRDGVDRYYGYHGYALRTIDEKSKQEQIDQTSKGKLLKILTKLPENDPKFDELLRLC